MISSTLLTLVVVPAAYSLIERRRQTGFVRECHGDLHLGNVVLIDEVPVIFDALEFNDELRWIDVANDMAFAWMDLLNHGQPGLANQLLNLGHCYLELGRTDEASAAYARALEISPDDVATLSIAATKKTSGIVTDDMAVTAEQALGIADKGYVLVQGSNRYTDTGTALLADPDVRRAFLGG